MGADKSVCIFLSHSGTTREGVKALKLAAERGTMTVGLAQNMDSPICRDADYGFGYMGKAVTIGERARENQV